MARLEMDTRDGATGPAKRRMALQLGLLGGIGLAFVAQHDPIAVAGGLDGCFEENECTFKKPNFLIVLDYSSSMSEPFGLGQTRWQVAVDAITQLMTVNGGYFQENMHVALLRYGHDPDPSNPDTAIPGDMSGLLDGQHLDVHWYDPDAADKTYFECNGEDIIASINATPAPLCPGGPGSCSGIGTWTKGALDFSKALIGQTKIDHPEDVIPGIERFYGLMVVTDGAWTAAQGFPQLSPPADNPAITAADLFDNQDIPTYVIAVADAGNLPFADELAAAGGTNQSIAADNPDDLFQAIGQVVQDIADQVIVPECTAGLPRVMVLLDGSSSMLNVGMNPGGPGETGWDRARSALASGANSLFDVDVDSVGRPVEDLIHLGLTVFGSNNPAEEKVLVQYGPCMQDNFGWALDPTTSCEQPGCDDPWGGPTITWTFKDGSQVAPFFDQETLSHMPACLPAGGSAMCQGSGTYTHRGLELIDDNQQQYASNPPALYPADDTTQYVNILITDGQYNGYSTDAQVQASLEAMFSEGVKTWVIGFGDNLGSAAAQQQLMNMASWGSGGQEPFFDADNQVELENALASIIDDIAFDPCCAFNDCSENPEPTTEEPDPSTTTFSTSGDGDGDSGDGDGDSGDGDGDSGDGDGDSGDGDGDSGDGDGDSGDGDGDSGDGDGDSGDGDGDTDGPDTNDDNADGWDSTGDEADGTGDENGFGFGNDAGLNGRGCDCSIDDQDRRGGPFALIGLALLGLLRPRKRQ